MRFFLPTRVAAILIATFTIALHAKGPLKLVQTIPLPNVKGRIDHLGLDLKRGRVYIAGLGNNTVEVVDIKAGKWIESLPGFRTPQGIWYVPSVDKVFAASGDDGTCRVFRGEDLKQLDSIQLAPGVNRIAYSPVRQQLYAGYGGKDAGWDYGEIGIINPENDRVVGKVKVASHPAEILADNAGKNLYVAIYPAAKLQVIDIAKRNVVATWDLGDVHPGDMAMDEATGRLFVGSKNPAVFVIYDYATGKQIARFPIIEGQDGVYFDNKLKRIYISGGRELGSGAVEVIQQKSPDRYEELARVPTGPGAGTSLFVPELNRLYVVVPSNAQKEAEVMVFEPQP